MNFREQRSLTFTRRVKRAKDLFREKVKDGAVQKIEMAKRKKNGDREMRKCFCE